MNYLYLLFICCVLFIIISIKISKSILSPEAIFLFVFLISIACAIYSSNSWGFVMNKKAFFVLLIGIITFLVIALVLKFNTKKIQSSDNYKLKPIRIMGIHLMIFTIIYGISSMIYIYCLCKVANTYNLLTVGSVYRDMTLIGINQVPLVARVCLNIVRAMSTVLVCVVVNNYVVKEFKRNHGLYLLFLIFIYVLLTLISGERTSLLRIITFFVLSYSVFIQRENGFKKLESLKLVVVLIAGLSTVLLMFSTIRHFVGRSSELNFVEYISLYAGGPIHNINYAIGLDPQPTYDGHYTFLGLYNNLARLGYGEVRTVHREVIRLESRHLYLGNVYTCFYDYYMDFGFVGVIILIAVYSLIINKLFINAKYNLKNPFFSCVMYSFFGTTLFFASFTEQFFSTYFAVSSVVLILIIMITTYIISLNKNNNNSYTVKLF